MVTPSLQTKGFPHFLAMSTHLDFGPSVTRTASARAEAPRKTFSRASALKSTCLYDLFLPYLRPSAISTPPHDIPETGPPSPPESEPPPGLAAAELAHFGTDSQYDVKAVFEPNETPAKGLPK